MKLQLQNLDGQVIAEKEIVLGEGDTLVMSFDMEKVDLELANNFFNLVREGLENNAKLVAVPLSFDFKVIKKQ